MKPLLLILTLMVALHATAQKDLNIRQFYPIDAMHSYVGFQIKYMGYAKVRGRFKDIQGTFRFDPNDLKKTSATISIGVESINTELEFRDNDLKSDNWFGAKTYPKITFVSTSATPTKTGVTVEGDLTIKSTTKKVKIDLNYSGALTDARGDTQAVFEGTLLLNRTDYGVEGKNWSAIKEGVAAVASEVTLEFTILGQQYGAENYRNRVKNVERPQGKLYNIINTQGVNAALAEFDKMKSAPDSKITLAILNTVGYQLMLENKIQEAETILKKNMEAFPEEGTVYDTYAEFLAFNGKWAEAKKYYMTSLEKNPNNINAKEIIRNIN